MHKENNNCWYKPVPDKQKQQKQSKVTADCEKLDAMEMLEKTWYIRVNGKSANCEIRELKWVTVEYVKSCRLDDKCDP